MVKKMSNWNINGEESQEKIYERHYIPTSKEGVPIAYEGIIIEISEIYTQIKLKKSQEDPDKEESRVTFTIKMKDDKEEDKNLPLFCAFKVSKGFGTYSNSKLYDLLDVAGLLEDAQKVAKSSSEDQLKFLRDNLIGKNVRFIVKTVRKGTPEQYSVVKEITWMPKDKVITEKVSNK